MSTATISIDRTSLSLGALTIGADTASTYIVTPDGLGDPGMVWRFLSMPDSADIHGREIVAAALEVGSIPLEVLVTGTSASNLRTNKNALTTALSQFTYEMTITIDGQTLTWTCDPANWAPSGNQIRHEYQAAFMQLLAITVPVYPIAT